MPGRKLQVLTTCPHPRCSAQIRMLHQFLLQSMWRSQTALGPSTVCDVDPVLPVLSNKTFSHTKCKRLASQTLAVGQILPGVCGQGPSLCTVPEGQLPHIDNLLISAYLSIILGGSHQGPQPWVHERITWKTVS